MIHQWKKAELDEEESRNVCNCILGIASNRFRMQHPKTYKAAAAATTDSDRTEFLERLVTASGVATSYSTLLTYNTDGSL